MNPAMYSIFCVAYVYFRLLCLRKKAGSGEILKYLESLKEKAGRGKQPKKGRIYKRLELISRIAGFLTRYLIRSENVCLYRSVVLYEACIKNGICCEILFGVAKDETELLGHSWIKVADRVFMEEEKDVERFCAVFRVRYDPDEIRME